MYYKICIGKCHGRQYSKEMVQGVGWVVGGRVAIKQEDQRKVSLRKFSTTYFGIFQGYSKLYTCVGHICNSINFPSHDVCMFMGEFVIPLFCFSLPFALSGNSTISPSFLINILSSSNGNCGLHPLNLLVSVAKSVQRNFFEKR